MTVIPIPTPQVAPDTTPLKTRKPARPVRLARKGKRLVLKEGERDLATVTEEQLGRPGLPWSGGQEYLEHKLELAPWKARGLGTQVGEYWKMRAMPQVQAAVTSIIEGVASSPYTLEKPELPPWAQDDPRAEAARDIQWELCQRIWHQWTRTGQSGTLDQHAETVLTFALICGFYLGELTASTKVWDLGAGQQGYLCPDLPHLRAPWTVCEWILEDEQPVGVIQTLFQTANDLGDRLGRVMLPWDKLLHIPLNPAGPSDLEGRSFIRGAYTPLKMLQGVYQTQALTIEVNGVGTWVVTQDPENPMPETERTKLQTHLLNYKGEHTPFIVAWPGADAKLVTAGSAVPNLTAQAGMYERAVELSLGQAHLGIATRGVGSHAARSDASSDSRATYRHLGRALIARPLEQLLCEFIGHNFPQDAEAGLVFCPRIVKAPTDVRDNVAEASAIATLTDAGHITPTRDTEEAYRERFGLPLLPELDPDVEAEDATTQTLAPEEAALQARLAVQSGLPYAVQEDADWFRRLVGMPQWTEAQRQQWLATRPGSGQNEDTPANTPSEQGQAGDE